MVKLKMNEKKPFKIFQDVYAFNCFVKRNWVRFFFVRLSKWNVRNGGGRMEFETVYYPVFFLYSCTVFLWSLTCIALCWCDTNDSVIKQFHYDLDDERIEKEKTIEWWSVSKWKQKYRIRNRRFFHDMGNAHTLFLSIFRLMSLSVNVSLEQNTKKLWELNNWI